MILGNTLYFLREASSSFRRNKLMTGAAVGAMALSLVLIGIFLLAAINLNLFVDRLRQRVDIVVFLKDDLVDVTALRGALEARKEVESITYLSKEEALAEFKKQLGPKRNWVDAVEANPLPASLELRLNHDHLNSIHQLSSWIESLDGVEEVNYGQRETELLSLVVKLILIFDLGLGLLLGTSSFFMVFNTMRLAIYSQREEIEIMRLVGATDSFISGPYIIGGIVQGFMGGAIALLVLVALYNLSVVAMDRLLGVPLGIAFLPFNLSLAVAVAGILLGLGGSIASIRSMNSS
jgi:cell division transport system permease protein